MKIAFALHQIETAEGPINPGTVTEFSDKHFAELKALGAIREPNEDELALANLGKAHIAEEDALTGNPLHAEAEALGVKFSKNISDETLSARIAEAKEAAAKAAEAANQPTDPDQVDL